MLVRINNVTGMTGTWPAYGANANMTITDSTGSMTMRILAGTDMDGSAAPAPPFDVIGAVSQYDTSSPYSSGFEVMPRQHIDIVESSSPLTILHDPAADSVTSCSATIRWYTNKTGDSSVDYGTTASYGSTATGASGVSVHSVILSDLSPNMTYHFRATSGGISSNDFTFTTGHAVAPTVLSGPRVSFITSTSVQIAWTTDIPGTSQVNYGASVAYGSSASGPSGVVEHYATLSGLSAATTYHYQVMSASAGCGGGSFGSADGILDTPPASSTPPEVSACGSQMPMTLRKVGAGLEVKFEYRGGGYNYHLYGASDQASMDAGSYSVKACDLKNNTQGTWSTDGATWASWTVASAAALPAAQYLAVAEVSGVEGTYGYKSDGSFIVHAAGKTAPTQIGCTAPCATISAAINSVTPGATVTLGTAQTFSGSGSGQGALSYAWDFHYNGSTFNTEATGASAVTTYASAGSYTAALRVTDSCSSPGPQSAIATQAITVNPATSCGPIVVISQVYGGGGNTSAYWKNDYIELHNRGDQAQNLSGWSVQYSSATGTTWQVTNLSGSIAAGGYFLVQEAVGAGGTASLPTPDATGVIPMSGTAGKVALVNTTTALSGACPTGTQIKDFVGFGTTANCYEGTGPTPAPSNTTMDKRNGEGCTDTNQNATDFTAIAANASNPPRNTASALVFCTCP